MSFRKTLFAILVGSLLLLPATPVRANGFGVGLLVQTTPSAAALSLAGEVGDKFVLAGALAPAFGQFDLLYGHVDFLFDLGEGFETGGGPIEFYFGPGVRFQVLDIDSIGARLPFGMRYNINDTDVEFFVEAAPIFDFYLNTPGDDYQVMFQGGLGIRYYFRTAQVASTEDQ